MGQKSILGRGKRGYKDHVARERGHRVLGTERRPVPFAKGNY